MLLAHILPVAERLNAAALAQVVFLVLVTLRKLFKINFTLSNSILSEESLYMLGYVV